MGSRGVRGHSLHAGDSQRVPGARAHSGGPRRRANLFRAIGLQDLVHAGLVGRHDGIRTPGRDAENLRHLRGRERGDPVIRDPTPQTEASTEPERRGEGRRGAAIARFPVPS